MKKFVPVLFLFLVTLFSGCATTNCVPSVAREAMPQKTDNYMMAFHAKNNACGLGNLVPEHEQFNHIMTSTGGADVANAFQVKVGKGARVFSARHTFIGCDPNTDMAVHSADVISLPASTSTGFTLSKEKLELGNCVSIEGFRFFETTQGSDVEWVKIGGEISFGTLEDTDHKGANPETWNNSDRIPLVKLEDKSFNHLSLKGLSGAPVFNSRHEVVALFSGVYKKPDGFSYLRLEEINPEARYVKSAGPITSNAQAGSMAGSSLKGMSTLEIAKEKLKEDLLKTKELIEVTGHDEFNFLNLINQNAIGFATAEKNGNESFGIKPDEGSYFMFFVLCDSFTTASKIPKGATMSTTGDMLGEGTFFVFVDTKKYLNNIEVFGEKAHWSAALTMSHELVHVIQRNVAKQKMQEVDTYMPHLQREIEAHNYESLFVDEVFRRCGVQMPNIDCNKLPKKGSVIHNELGILINLAVIKSCGAEFYYTKASQKNK